MILGKLSSTALTLLAWHFLFLFALYFFNFENFLSSTQLHMKSVIKNVIIMIFLNISRMYFLKQSSLFAHYWKRSVKVLLSQQRSWLEPVHVYCWSEEFFLFFIVDGNDGISFGKDVSMLIDFIEIFPIFGVDRLVNDRVDSE